MPELNINGTRYPYDKNPDSCPMCHHAVEPVNLTHNVVTRERRRGNSLQIIFRCPSRDCQRAFVATYRQNHGQGFHGPEGDYLLKSTAPHYAVEPEIHEDVKSLSPEYVNLIAQSSSAEHYQLDQIAGVGYRKALEYLIKDYAIHKNPDNEEDIKASFLGNCIANHVDDANVQACARRAAWLGNDETHYVRKWEEKDINDLKTLIQLTEAWILNNLLTEKYMDEMQ